MRAVGEGQRGEDRELGADPDHTQAHCERYLAPDVRRARAMLVEGGQHPKADDDEHPPYVVLRAVAVDDLHRESGEDAKRRDRQSQREAVDARPDGRRAERGLEVHGQVVWC